MAAQDQASLWIGLRELYGTLSAGRRRQLYVVLGLMLAGAFAELATIGAVLPFLSLLADPARIEHVPAISAFFHTFGTTSDQQRLVAAAALFVLLAAIAAAVRLQLNWSSQGFIFGLGHDLAVEIQRRILSQPYSFHIERNTSSLLAALEKTATLVFYVLLQMMQATIAAVLSIFIVVTLIYIDAATALIAAAGFSLIYLAVSRVTRGRLERNSEVAGRAWDERMKIVQESLGGIRDVIIDGSQPVYLETFRRIDDQFTRAKASTSFISTAPRYIIEALGMALIAVLAIVISSRQGAFAVALPILGALALGAQRLLPLLQQIYVSWSVAAGHRSVMSQVLDLLRLPVDDDPARPVANLPLRRHIRFDRVSFTYPSRRGPAIDDVSLEIVRGERVALIGKTGSGKSTLADLLMGLLDPTRGTISIDGVTLSADNRRNWRRSIAHVPQAIFLADATIARNIALGAPEDALDLPLVINAARKAQLDAFVETLPESYETRIGERGVRLSGGQRQRLAIARAIYKQAPVLVLDEATSALDDVTEAAVMHALDQLGAEGRTIIMIAHRLSSVAHADKVIRLDNGRLAELGSYSEVVGAIPQMRVF